MGATPDPLIRTTIAGIESVSPIMLAAGTAGTLDELAGVTPMPFVGAVVSKSITLEPRAGNDTWRILDSRAGMLNAIGLANPGVDHFIDAYLPRAGGLGTNLIVSIAGYHADDYAEVAGRIERWCATQDRDPVAAFELNVSCPNVDTGLEFGLDPGALAGIIASVRDVAPSRPTFVKLSPIMQDPVAIATAAIDAGSAALTVANTVPAMEIDLQSKRARLANGTGGLSGPAIHPIAVRLVHQIYRGVARERNVPIIGAGGVTSWRDAAQLILAGASAIQIGTLLFADPRAPRKLARGLTRWVRSEGCALGDLVGVAAVNDA